VRVVVSSIVHGGPCIEFFLRSWLTFAYQLKKLTGKMQQTIAFRLKNSIWKCSS